MGNKNLSMLIAKYEQKKQKLDEVGININIIPSARKYETKSVIITDMHGSHTIACGTLTKDTWESILLNLLQDKYYKNVSFASGKYESSHNGKNREKQSMTYCKKSSNLTKDVLKNILIDNCEIVLDYDINNKNQLANLFYLYLTKKIKVLNNFNYYVTKNMIRESISSFINFNIDKIPYYISKYNLKTNNNNFAFAIYHAIKNNKIVELV